MARERPRVTPCHDSAKSHPYLFPPIVRPAQVMSPRMKEKLRQKIEEQQQLQMAEQHAAISWRLASHPKPRLSMHTCLANGALVIEVHGQARLVAIAGDLRPVRLRTGSWWMEFELRSLPADESGQLRLGVMSDRLSEREAAAYTIDIGRARASGQVTAHEWHSGLQRGAQQSTRLACTGDMQSTHRVALQLSFPGSNESAKAASSALSWTREGGTFDDLQVGQRVVIADDAYCAIIMGSEWTESHKYYCALASTGEVVELDATSPERPHVMGCQVKLRLSTSNAARASGSGSALGTDDGSIAPILRFLPGCLLNVPEAATGSTESGCLMFYYREGGEGAEVRQHKASVFSIPDGTAVRPFIEWIPDNTLSTGPLVVAAAFTEPFQLRDDSRHMPVVSEVLSRALSKQRGKAMWNSVLGSNATAFNNGDTTDASSTDEALRLMAAVNKITQRFLTMMQKKFVSTLRRRVRVRFAAEQRGKFVADRRIGQNYQREELLEHDELARLKAVLSTKQHRLSASTGKVRNYIHTLMVRDASGVLRPTTEGKRILRLKHAALRQAQPVSEAQAEKVVVAEQENVARILKEFETGRLAKGGFFDAELELEREEFEAARAAAAAAAASDAAAVNETTKPSNAELLAAAQLPVSRGSLKLSTAGTLGDLSLPPPDRTDAEWLIDCVRLFREPLDLSIQRVVPTPQAYVQKLKGIVRVHARFIDDQAVALSAIRDVLQEVTEGDRKGGSDKKGGKRTDFDSEMVQEQQQEEEKQKEQEQEQQDQVEHDNDPKEDTCGTSSPLPLGARRANKPLILPAVLIDL